MGERLLRAELVGGVKSAISGLAPKRRGYRQKSYSTVRFTLQTLGDATAPDTRGGRAIRCSCFRIIRVCPRDGYAALALSLPQGTGFGPVMLGGPSCSVSHTMYCFAASCRWHVLPWKRARLRVASGPRGRNRPPTSIPTISGTTRQEAPKRFLGGWFDRSQQAAVSDSAS